MDAALAPLRLQDIRALNYRLILAQLEKLAAHSKLHSNSQTENHFSRGSVGYTEYDEGAFVPCTCNFNPEHCKKHQVRSGAFRITNLETHLMAAAAHVIPLGLLNMRPLQFWLRSKGFHPRNHPSGVQESRDQGYVLYDLSSSTEVWF